MLKVVLWILAILLLVGIAMLNPLIAAGIDCRIVNPVVFEEMS